jgi:hypothetical protein
MGFSAILLQLEKKKVTINRKNRKNREKKQTPMPPGSGGKNCTIRPFFVV